MLKFIDFYWSYVIRIAELVFASSFRYAHFIRLFVCLLIVHCF